MRASTVLLLFLVGGAGLLAHRRTPRLHLPQLQRAKWVAEPRYVKVLDTDLRVRHSTNKAVYATPSVPHPTPTPVESWNPTFPIDAKGNIHGNSAGRVSSIVTISGGDCTPVQVAVFVYGNGFVPQRSVAIDYGRGSVYDALSPGNVDWRKYLAHAEIQAPLHIRSAWFSADFRSIGYRHDASSSTPLVCPPGAPAPAPGRARRRRGLCYLDHFLSQIYRLRFGDIDRSLELRTGLELVPHGPVAELAYFGASDTANGFTIRGVGYALEVPPSLDQTFGVYGSLSYFPSVTGGGTTSTVWRYRLGATLSLAPLFGRPGAS